MCFILQACLADEIDEIEEAFETTKWNTYVRYVSNNKSLLYVLIFILFIAAVEVNRNLVFIIIFIDYVHTDCNTNQAQKEAPS